MCVFISVCLVVCKIKFSVNSSGLCEAKAVNSTWRRTSRVPAHPQRAEVAAGFHPSHHVSVGGNPAEPPVPRADRTRHPRHPQVQRRKTYRRGRTNVYTGHTHTHTVDPCSHSYTSILGHRLTQTVHCPTSSVHDYRYKYRHLKEQTHGN